MVVRQRDIHHRPHDDQAVANHRAILNRVHTQDGDYATGFLLPPLQTETGAQAIARNIRQVRSYLGLPVAVETGVNYLRRQPWELPDGEFTARVCQLAGCDLLLDLHNVWTNERNGRQSARNFLAQLDPTRVREIHLAGGFEYQGFWLDAHSGLVPHEVMALAREVVPRLPALRAIHIEILPQFIPLLDLDALRNQIHELHGIWQTRGSRPDGWYVLDAAPSPPEPEPPGCTPACWESTLGALVTGKTLTCDTAWSANLARDPGIPLFTDLARTFRAGVVVENLKMSSRYLMLSLEKAGFRRLLNEFWRDRPPEPYAVTECRAFAAWLQSHDPGLPYLRTLLDYDLALTELKPGDPPCILSFDCEPMGLLKALGAGVLPERIEPGVYELELLPGRERQQAAAAR